MKVIKVNKGNKPKQTMTKVEKVVAAILIGMISLTTIGILRQNYFEKYYEVHGGYVTTTAFCDKIGYKKSKQHCMPINYHFFVDGKRINKRGETVPYRLPYTALEIGDSLLISYAVLDPSFNEVIKVKK